MTPERLQEIKKHIAELGELKVSLPLSRGDLLFACGVLIGLTRECAQDMRDLLTALREAEQRTEYWQGYANRRQDDAIIFKQERDALQQRVEEVNELKTALGDSTVLLQACARRLGDLVTIPEQVGKNRAALRGGGTG